MAKATKDRYADCDALQADLARVAAGRSVTKVHRFKKRGAVSKRKIGAIAAASAIAVAAVLAGLLWVWTDSVKADLAEAIRQADTATASGDYAGTKATLEQAISAVPARPERENLIAPAARKLRDITAKAAEQEAAARRAGTLARKRQHEQSAVTAAADIKA